MNDSQHHVNKVFDLIASREAKRNHELSRYPRTAPLDDDDVHDFSTPVLVRFFARRGAAGIKLMTNFTPNEIHLLWESISGHILANWNVSRGRKCSYSGKDVFFMLLVVLKNGGTWDMNANIFQVKTPSFKKMIVGFLEQVWLKLYSMEIEDKAKRTTMRRLATSDRTFEAFPAALYATDATF